MSKKKLNERRADNLEKLALVFLGAAFVGQFAVPYRVLLAMLGVVTYIVAEWLIRRDEGGADDDHRS